MGDFITRDSVSPDVAALNPDVFGQVAQGVTKRGKGVLPKASSNWAANKYRAEPAIYNGQRYHSTGEAEYAALLDLEQYMIDIRDSSVDAQLEAVRPLVEKLQAENKELQIRLDATDKLLVAYKKEFWKGIKE